MGEGLSIPGEGPPVSIIVSYGDLSIPVPGYLVVVDMGKLEALRLPWPCCCDGQA